MEQKLKNGFAIIIEPSDLENEMLTGNYGGNITVLHDGKIVDECWIAISKNGIARIERLK